MNKTHEELADEAYWKIHDSIRKDDDAEPETVRPFILSAITAAVQAERERERAVLEQAQELLRLSKNQAARGMIAAELARLSLNDSREALSE